MKIVDQSVEYVDHMGNDLSIVNAARVSFDKISDYEYDPPTGETIESATAKGYPIRRWLKEGDIKLIKYLSEHGHWTPFGHATVSLRVKAPIFVARQLVKHQVGLVWNEVSRRYVSDEPEFYFPTEFRGKPVNAKQGSTGTTEDSEMWLSAMQEHIKNSLAWYTSAISAGIAPEQARMILPQNMMTEWIWSGSLMAFARVCNLRLDPHSQLETREVAQMINSVVKPLFPVSWEFLVKCKS